MRIGIEAQRIFREKKHGMDVVALESIRALQALDTQNEYFVFVKPGEDRQVWQGKSNFQLVEIPAYSYLDWEQYQLPRYARKFGLDVLHCTSNTAPVFGKTPLLITLHDVIFMEQWSWQGSAYQVLGNLYRRWNIPQTYHRAARLFTVSEFEKKQILQTLQPAPAAVEVIYNAVGRQFRPLEEAVLADFRAKYQLPAQFILFLGNTAPKKNLPRVLEAYAHYRQNTHQPLPLVLAEAQAPVVRRLLGRQQGSSLLPHLHFVGYVPPSAMPMLYNLASLFLYPSLRESFGLPILEAMACGTPVLTSDTSAMPEIAGGAAYLVNPYQAEAIAEGMASVLHTPGRAAQLRQKGKARAAEFTWQHTARQLWQHYQAFAA